PSASSGRGGSGPGCRTHSFAPDTRVLMADGTTRPITDINIGDQVIATDPVTGTSSPKPVTQLHRNTDHELTDVRVRTSDGTSTVVETTPNHPFWDDNRQAWVNAGDLKPGAKLRVAGRGEATVESVQTRRDQREMRDLTVADTHTYHVLAGDHPVLVHNNNASCDVPTLKGYAQQIREAGDHPAAVNQRVIAVGQDEAGNLVAGSSNGFDAGQAAAADALGIRRVPSRRGRHAEENLIADNDGSMWPLKRVGTDARTPCGPTAPALFRLERFCPC
ncbi:Hint domain-containing protein, partial [Micromonospora sp. LOL_023]|uniref:Hint domain-containing protein n=1 Tax=Micromonospora sp. LOL_023 TaxID=3345418 RepID=UPI003A86F466